MLSPEDKAACYGYRMTAPELVAFLKEEMAAAEEVSGQRYEGFKQAAEMVALLEGRAEPLLRAAARAYGVLWQDLSGSRKAGIARNHLTEVLTNEERALGIQWANDTFGPVTEADIRNMPGFLEGEGDVLRLKATGG